MAKVVDVVRELIESELQAQGYELFDLTFSKEGKEWYLRIYIDKPGGVTLDDCVDASEAISAIVDQAEPDPIPQAYYLEVSSPGAERPLKTEADIQKAIGQWIHLNFYKEYQGHKQVEGKLLQADEEAFTLETKDKTRRLEGVYPRKNVSLIRLAIEF